MATHRLMCSTILSRSPYPCTVIDVLDEGILVVRVDMLPGLILDVVVDMVPDIGIIVMTTSAIALVFVVEIANAGDTLTGVLGGPIIDVFAAIDVDMLADENVNGLVVVMAPLVEFALSAP